MIKLQELENTAVHLPTQGEWDEYSQLCEDVGWMSCDGVQPMSVTWKNRWLHHEHGSSVDVSNNFGYSRLSYRVENQDTVITLQQLKEIFTVDDNNNNIWEPKNGEMILVADHDTAFEPREFIGMDKGLFVCKGLRLPHNPYDSWEMAKQIVPVKHTITLDGKEVEISEESYLELSKAINMMG